MLLRLLLFLTASFPSEWPAQFPCDGIISSVSLTITDGIGAKDKRPARPELAWLGTESNQFGTDEFLHWLSVLGPNVQPYFCLNFGTGTLDEALAWVQYCNGTKDTYYANLRRKNGREEPYGIKYWALGNEVGLASDKRNSSEDATIEILTMIRSTENGKSRK